MDDKGAKICCAARWPGDDGGGVLAIGGQVLTDPIPVTQREVRAIDENERFARNLVNFLLGQRFERSQNEPLLSLAWVRAENNLANFVVSVLSKSFGPRDDQWWPQVPLPVRQNCAKRQQEELGRGLPMKGYLQVTDLKDRIKLQF